MILDARTAPIHRTLEPYLNPKDLAYALRLWIEQFIEQSNLSLKTYIESFYNRQPIELRSHELYNRLLPAMLEAFKARSQYEGELIEPYEFPDYDLASPERKSESPAPQTLPETQKVPELLPVVEEINEEETAAESASRIEKYEVFSFFIRILCGEIPEIPRNKLFEYHANNLEECCVYPVGEHFLIWLKGGTNYFEDKGLSSQHMSRITHALYMGMCDYLGPVETDNALTYAMRLTVREFPQAKADINQYL